MSARAVMVWGTSSGAGKSWLTTALCRCYARRGLKVAPFKAQNMSNNARVVAAPPNAQGNTWGEIGSAQYLQALAARAAPHVHMNPVLLKPEQDTRSQVVVMGRVDTELTVQPWRERSAALWAHALQGLQALREENDVLVIEGAGSPAEINLMDVDYVNLQTARAAEARALLVTDIDRGGAFAHLYGTHQLLPAEDRARIAGFVLNKFRGDAALLAPGPQQLQQLTGVPTVAVLPMWRDHGLPEEDGVFDDAPTGPRPTGAEAPLRRIAIVAYPRISNLDEFQPLRGLPGVRLIWARDAAALESADWIVLPGSKHTSGDLAWLRAQGLDRVIAAHARAGRPVLGICGGLQMLGEALVDPEGVESAGPGQPGANAPGLGLLPLVTAFATRKTVRPATARLAGTQGVWQSLQGVPLAGYEIRHGRTVQHTGLAPAPVILQGADGEPLGWQQGSVLGLYVHGLFESPEVLKALFGAHTRTLDAVFDALADTLEAHMAPGVLDRLIDPRPTGLSTTRRSAP